MGWLIKQPNGKFCSIDSFGRLEYFNYTAIDIMNTYIDKAKRDMDNAEHYGKIIEYIESGNTLRTENVATDKQLKQMGFDKSYNELVKFIPRRPQNTKYVSCDFATHGKCPNCGENVQNGMGYSDEKCKCGQLLDWR